jgi:hypothetical protein
MGVETGIAIFMLSEDSRVETQLHGGATVTEDTSQIVKAHNANVFGRHNVIVRCRGSDGKMVGACAAGDIAACACQKSLLRQLKAGGENLTTFGEKTHRCTLSLLLIL